MALQVRDVSFLTTLSGEALISISYNKPINETWVEAATALAAAAGPGDSAAAEAYTPGCVLKLMQLKSAKGADGKYTRLEPGRDLVALTRTRTLTLTLTLTLALALTP